MTARGYGDRLRECIYRLLVPRRAVGHSVYILLCGAPIGKSGALALAAVVVYLVEQWIVCPAIG